MTIIGVAISNAEDYYLHWLFDYSLFKSDGNASKNAELAEIGKNLNFLGLFKIRWI